MRTRTLILIAATLATVACKKSGDAANTPANNAAGAAGNSGTAMIPEHGGAMATSGGMITEVVTQPDGRLAAYVRGPEGPVQDANVRVTVRNTDGTSKPVVVAWDAQSSAYVGYVWGVEPGQKTVDVTVPGVTASAPPLTVTSQVNVAGVAHPPAARYGGSVEIIGQYAVEIVPSRTGDVAFFVMDMQGNPVPDANIDLPRVAIDTSATASVGGSIAVGGSAGATVNLGTPPNNNAGGAVVVPPAANGTVAVAAGANAPLGTAVVVPVQRSGDHWVAHVDTTVIANLPTIGFNVDLNVGGHTYTKATVPSATVVAALPPTVSVPAAPAGGVVVVNAPVGGGSVVVNPPAAAGSVAVQVQVQAPALPPGVNVNARVMPPAVPVPTGGIVVAPPSVRAGMQAPQMPTVMVGGPVPMAGGAVVVNAPPPAGGVVVAPPGAGGRVLVMPPGPPRVGVVVNGPPAVAGVVVNGPAARAGVVVAGPVPAGGVVVTNAPPRPPVMPPPPNFPPPPGPPAVNVQGGVQFGGSINIH